MPSPYANTPLQHTMRNIAEDALTRTDGMRMVFTVTRFGSLAAAKRACRTSQIAFATLRAKEHRRKQSMLGDKELRERKIVRGRYDELMCNTHVTEDESAWILEIVRAHMMEDLVELQDATTHETVQLPGYGVQGKITLLIGRFFKAVESARDAAHFINPWDDDDITFMIEHARGIVEDFDAKYGTRMLSGGVAQQDAPADDMADMDLTDWAKGEDAGGEENEG